MRVGEFEGLAEVRDVFIVDDVFMDLLVACVYGVAAGLVEKSRFLQFRMPFSGSSRLALDDSLGSALADRPSEPMSVVSQITHFIC